MAATICYLVAIEGSSFNRLMRSTHQATEEHINTLIKRRELDLWDGMFLSNSMEFLVDLTGDWTLCVLPLPYSLLLDDSQNLEDRERIRRWESRLLQLVPSADVIRVSDSLWDKWSSVYDYLLIRHRDAICEFIKWLAGQDNKYWCFLRGNWKKYSDPDE